MHNKAKILSIASNHNCLPLEQKGYQSLVSLQCICFLGVFLYKVMHKNFKEKIPTLACNPQVPTVQHQLNFGSRITKHQHATPTKVNTRFLMSQILSTFSFSTDCLFLPPSLPKFLSFRTLFAGQAFIQLLTNGL